MPMKNQQRKRLWTCESEARLLLGESAELGEIGDVLLQHPRIADSVSIPKAKEGDDDKKIRRRLFRISTENKDRHGDVVRSSGIQLKNFRRNPVVLFAHQANMPPVGLSKSQAKGDGFLDAEVDFFDADIYDFADTIFRIVSVGGLKATSIGFIPIKYGKLDDEEGEGNARQRQVGGGFDFQKVDLLEFSIVPIPANPEAVSRAFGEGADMSRYKEWLDDMGDNWNVVKDILLDLGVTMQDLVSVRKAASGNRTTVAVVEKRVERAPEKKETTILRAVRDVATGLTTFQSGTPGIVYDGAEWPETMEINLSLADVGDDVSIEGDVISFKTAKGTAYYSIDAEQGEDEEDGHDVVSCSLIEVEDKPDETIETVEDQDENKVDQGWGDEDPLKTYPDLFLREGTGDLLTVLSFVAEDGAVVKFLHKMERGDLVFEERNGSTTGFSVRLTDNVDLEAVVRDGLKIQAVSGRKSHWENRDAFFEWAERQNYSTDDVDETRNFWTLRQCDPDDVGDIKLLSLVPNDTNAKSQDCKVRVACGVVVENVEIERDEDEDPDLVALLSRTVDLVRELPPAQIALRSEDLNLVATTLLDLVDRHVATDDDEGEADEEDILAIMEQLADSDPVLTQPNIKDDGDEDDLLVGVTQADLDDVISSVTGEALGGIAEKIGNAIGTGMKVAVRKETGVAD